MEIEQTLIAIRMNDGRVSIMTFLTRGRGSVLPRGARWIADGWWERDPTRGAIEREIAAALPAGSVTSWRLAEARDFPSDRSFRDAWRDTGAGIEHDMTHAREIHRNRLRAARKARLAELDGQWMRAFARGTAEESATIEAERQRLRDAPADPRIDAAQTVEDLKEIKLG